MKKDIHPDYKMITVRLADGTEFQTRSTMKNAASCVFFICMYPRFAIASSFSAQSFEGGGVGAGVGLRAAAGAVGRGRRHPPRRRGHAGQRADEAPQRPPPRSVNTPRRAGS